MNASAWTLTAIGVPLAAFSLFWLLRLGLHAALLRGLRAPRLPHAGTAGGNPPAQAVEFRTAGGKRLFAWFLPAAGRAPAVVLMHGWGANASMMLPLAYPLQAAGWAVLLPDARCHGRSDDETFTSLPRFAQDIDAALDWLRQQPGIDTARLALIGHSVGAGAALLCASRRSDLSAVVSVSAFAHPAEVMRRWLAERRLPYAVIGQAVLHHVQQVIGARFDAIAPLATIAQLRCPVLLVHGTDDQTVPFTDAQRLYSAAPAGAVQLAPVAGGHDPSEHIHEQASLVIEFLRRCPPTTAPAAPAPPETALKIPTPAPTAPPQKAAR